MQENIKSFDSKLLLIQLFAEGTFLEKERIVREHEEKATEEFRAKKALTVEVIVRIKFINYLDSWWWNQIFLLETKEDFSTSREGGGNVEKWRSCSFSCQKWRIRLCWSLSRWNETGLEKARKLI